MPATIYFISGSNRGIGLGLVAELAKRSDVVIFAGARDPSKATELNALADKYPAKIHVVKFVAADVEGNKALAKEIEQKYGRLDVIISSAGISNYLGSVHETPVEQMTDHFNVNVNGTIVLFQTMYHLLKASSSPKLVLVTSGAASLTAFIHLPAGYAAYGTSKVALNYVGRRIHFENPWLTCFLLAPGVVTTDMATLNRKLDTTGSLAPLQDTYAISAEECAVMLFRLTDQATREKDGGEFYNIDGSKVPW